MTLKEQKHQQYLRLKARGFYKTYVPKHPRSHYAVSKRDPEQVKAYHKEYATRPKTCYRRYKVQAAGRHIAFDLTFDQYMALWQKDCHYCGCPIATVGIDRVDNCEGYTVGNVVPCCATCNFMKLTQTAEAFIEKCRLIAERNPFPSSLP